MDTASRDSNLVQLWRLTQSRYPNEQRALYEAYYRGGTPCHVLHERQSKSGILQWQSFLRRFRNPECQGISDSRQKQ